MIKKNGNVRLLVAALLIPAFLSACSNVPSLTDSANVKEIPDGYAAVSACYAGAEEERPVVKEMIMEACPKGTTELIFWDNNSFMNSCPVMKRQRVTFLCKP